MLFNQTNVNRVEWLNLVFENRNQSYGAYVLRKESGNYLLKALLITICLLIGLFLFSAFRDKPEIEITSSVSDPFTPEIITDIELIKNPTLKKEPLKKSETSAPKKVEDVKKIKYSGNIVPVNQPKIDIQLPSEKDLKNSIIGSVEKDGKLTTDGTNAIEGKLNGGSGSGDGNGNETINANVVEQMPEFPGGMAAWGKFLNKNLNYPPMARDANVTGRVMVSFVVEKNGQITDVKILRGIGAGCDEEAVRVIKKSPFWKAGIQNGRAVRVSYVMPIVFRLD